MSFSNVKQSHLFTFDDLLEFSFDTFGCYVCHWYYDQLFFLTKALFGKSSVITGYWRVLFERKATRISRFTKVKGRCCNLKFRQSANAHNFLHIIIIKLVHSISIVLWTIIWRCWQLLYYFITTNQLNHHFIYLLIS